MGILFGLIAALCWGTGDFLVTRLVVSLDPYASSIRSTTIAANNSAR